jgi:hypothetical protein
MNAKRQRELHTAIADAMPLDQIVGLLRRYKDQGITQAEVYAFLEELHRVAPDEETDDRILEVADFVAGFCAPHMKVWDGDERGVAKKSDQPNLVPLIPQLSEREGSKMDDGQKDGWLMLILSALDETQAQSPEQIKEKLEIPRRDEADEPDPQEDYKPYIDKWLKRLVKLEYAEHPSRGKWLRTMKGSAVFRRLQEALHHSN